MKLAEAALVDLPLSAVERVFSSGAKKELSRAGWEAYDAAVGIVTELTGRAYSTPAVGRVVGRAMERTLRFQRLADAAAGALFATLWPALGLPTAIEVRALRDAVNSLREELRAASIQPGQANHVPVVVEAGREQPAEPWLGQNLYRNPAFRFVPPPVPKVKSHVGH